MSYSDTFLDCLYEISGKYSLQISRSYFAVRLGHWLRISLAFQLPKQVNIGNPISDSFWDFISFKHHCFSDAGINASLYISESRINKASPLLKNILAKNNKITRFSNLSTLQHYIKKNEGYGILTCNTGQFKVIKCGSKVQILSLCEQNACKPVFLCIHSIKVKSTIPWNSLLYWGWIFERGEEPTEIAIENSYSCVSGWKAYARWIQAYNLPANLNKFHQKLNNLSALLKDRRSVALDYLDYLIQIQKNSEIAFVLGNFKKIILELLPHLETLHNSILANYSMNVQDILLKCYFIEQKTRIEFKKIKRLYHDLIYKQEPGSN